MRIISRSSIMPTSCARHGERNMFCGKTTSRFREERLFATKRSSVFCFCSSIILVIIAVLFAAFIPPASAVMQQAGPNLYNAGVYTVDFNTAKQKGDFWCWAACIEMVLKYHGMDISQESMVQKIHGSLADKTAQPMEVLQALTGTGQNVSGGTSRIYAEGYQGLYQYFIQDLINGYPLIVALNYGTEIGHAVVLTAVSFSMDTFGNYYPLSVTIRDPWPGNMDRQEIPFIMLSAGCFFSARVAAVPY